jgi:hypothetical protein
MTAMTNSPNKPARAIPIHFKTLFIGTSTGALF